MEKTGLVTYFTMLSLWNITGGYADFCFRDAEDVESEIRVGFVTYSNALHFYNIKVLIINCSLVYIYVRLLLLLIFAML